MLKRRQQLDYNPQEIQAYDSRDGDGNAPVGVANIEIENMDNEESSAEPEEPEGNNRLNVVRLDLRKPQLTS